MSNVIFRGTPWSQTANGSLTTVATQTGVANQTIYITDVTASSDQGTAVLVIKAGSTIIWQDRIGNTSAYEHAFVTPLPGINGTQTTATVSGTASNNSYINIAGVIIDNT
jgi:hypothetical protein